MPQEGHADYNNSVSWGHPGDTLTVAKEADIRQGGEESPPQFHTHNGELDHQLVCLQLLLWKGYGQLLQQEGYDRAATERRGDSVGIYSSEDNDNTF